MKINTEEYYTPNEMIYLLDRSVSNEDTSKQIILRHIRNGTLIAKNVGGKLKPRYLIQGKNIVDYKNRKLKK